MEQLKIFGWGVWGLLGILTILVFPGYSLAIAMAAVAALIVMGFVLQPKQEYQATPLRGAEWDDDAPLYYRGKLISAPYDSILIFRIRLRRLWPLAFPLSILVAYFICVLRWGVTGVSGYLWENPQILYVLSLVGVPTAIFTYSWVRERFVLRDSLICLGIAYQTRNFSDRFDHYQFEFLGPDQQRRGGNFKVRSSDSNLHDALIVVLVRSSNFDRFLPRLS